MRTLLLMLTLTGCRIVYPGDGRPVYVHFDDAVAERRVVFADGSSGTLAPILEEAFGWWKEGGVDFVRSAREADGTLNVHSDPWWQGAYEDSWAVYMIDGGDIYLFLNDWDLGAGAYTKDGTGSLTSVFAHELGHAIGLDHDPHHEAVMHSSPGNFDGLTIYDLKDLDRRWPNGGVQ